VIGAGYLIYLWKTGKLFSTAEAIVNKVENTVSDAELSTFKGLERAEFPQRPRITCAKGIMIINSVLSTNIVSFYNEHYKDQIVSEWLECTRFILIPKIAYLTSGSSFDLTGVVEDDSTIYGYNVKGTSGPKTPEEVARGELVISFDKKHYKVIFISEAAKLEKVNSLVAATLSLYGVSGPESGIDVVDETGYGIVHRDLDTFMQNALRGIFVRTDAQLPRFWLMPPASKYKARYGKTIDLPFGALVVDRPVFGSKGSKKVHRYVFPASSTQFVMFTNAMARTS
jgi:hypothetical protein